MRPQTYLTFEDKLYEAIDSKGKIALPNVKLIEDPEEALRAIASTTKVPDRKPYDFKIRDIDPPEGMVQREVTWYPKIFMNTGGMGGRFDGSGVILAGGYPKARAFRFTMCEHEWDESGANHNRGWHPKRCTKCGFDASIDSGD